MMVKKQSHRSDEVGLKNMRNTTVKGIEVFVCVCGSMAF